MPDGTCMEGDTHTSGYRRGGKFTKPVISNSKDRQSLINQIKTKMGKLTKPVFLLPYQSF
jgi:hypothetical protein